MELTRLIRVLRERWRIVALIAVIGLVAAFGFTSLANRSVESRHEALVAMRYDPDEGQTVEDLADQVEDARGLAVLAAEDLLSEYPGSSIFADRGSGRLFFRAEADTRDAALERVNDLLNAYLLTDPVVGGDLEARITALEAEASQVASDLATISGALTPGEQALLGQHELLEQSIAAVRDRIAGLFVADATAGPAQRQQNAAERENLQTTLDDLIAQKAALAPKPSTDLTTVELLQRNVLQRRLDQISVDYERLVLRTLGVIDTGATREPAISTDLTPDPANPLVNAFIGLIGGTGLALFALIFVTRSRREVWLPEDLPIPVLSEVVHRRVTNLPGPPWYDTTETGARKEGIQAARTAIEGWLETGGGAFALTGDHVGAVPTHALAVDLAASFASAGRSVLLIGADYSEPIELTEYEVGEPSLQSVLRLPSTPAESLDDRLQGVMDGLVLIRRDLAVMPAGQRPESPADALAGPPFRRFVELAKARFDLVVAVGGEAESAASQVLMQRMGAAIIAIEPGSTTAPRFNSLLADVSQQKVDLPGVIMIRGTESRISLPTFPRVQPRVKSQPRPAGAEPISRLHHYPFPGSKRSPVPADGSLDHLADGLARSLDSSPKNSASRPAEAPMGEQILEALEETDRSRSFGPVAEYVVARIEDMMTAVPGQPNVSPQMVDVVLEYGFMPLTRVSGIASAGERLVFELGAEIGQDMGPRLAARMSEILTEDGDDAAEALDGWLSKEFFSRHLQRTGREPEVWHLSSGKGTVQVLVNGRRLTDQRIGMLTTDVVRRTIADLQVTLKNAQEGGDDATQAWAEAGLRDAHLFEIALGLLRGGVEEDARLVYPWRRNEPVSRGWNPIWAEGIKANIAPLQRLELLSEPVLTDDEMNELLPTG